MERINLAIADLESDKELTCYVYVQGANFWAEVSRSEALSVLKSVVERREYMGEAQPIPTIGGLTSGSQSLFIGTDGH